VKGIGEVTRKRLDKCAPHRESSLTSAGRTPITPLPKGEGTEVNDNSDSSGEAGKPRLRRDGDPGPRDGRYVSLWDFWRRTRIAREQIEHVIRLGGFAWTGLHERELLWQLGLFYQPLSGQLPLALPYDADLVALREMTGRERVTEDLTLTEGAIAVRGHIMDLARLHEGITPSYLVDQLEDGAKVIVGGFVAVRQAPETAKGFVFHTLEDRYGLINVINAPNIVRKYKQLVAEAGALIVHGHIERQDRAINVVTEHMEALPLAAAVPAARTHNFG
jgi:error-prone DNA polymerase